MVRERKRIAWILLLLAVLFALCWLPYNVLRLLVDFGAVGECELVQEPRLGDATCMPTQLRYLRTVEPGILACTRPWCLIVSEYRGNIATKAVGFFPLRISPYSLFACTSPCIFNLDRLLDLSIVICVFGNAMFFPKTKAANASYSCHYTSTNVDVISLNRKRGEEMPQFLPRFPGGGGGHRTILWTQYYGRSKYFVVRSSVTYIDNVRVRNSLYEGPSRRFTSFEICIFQEYISGHRVVSR